MTPFGDLEQLWITYNSVSVTVPWQLLLSMKQSHKLGLTLIATYETESLVTPATYCNA